MGFSKEEYINLIKSKKLDDIAKYRINNIPKKLYKYISLNNDREKKIKTLKNRKFWLSNCENLNDPFEMKALYINEERVKEYNISTELIEVISETHHKLLIGCFTNSKTDNMPMWAHYGDNHKGICVEYKINRPECFFPIFYEEKKIDVTKIFIASILNINKKIRKKKLNKEEEEELEFITKFLNHNTIIKHKSWEYEDEYRLLFPKINENKNGEEIKIDELCIEVTGIYIGMNTSDEDNELIKLGNELGVNVYKMFIDDKKDNYGLSYKKINS